MKDGLLEAQLIVPSLNSEGSLTASLNCVEDLTLELKSNIKLPKTTYLQRITFQYGIGSFSNDLFLQTLKYSFKIFIVLNQIINQ